MEWPFNKINYMLFGIGLLSIVFGYLIIEFYGNSNTNSIGAIKVGPIMLFLGYCIFIPISIIYKSKN